MKLLRPFLIAATISAMAIIAVELWHTSEQPPHTPVFDLPLALHSATPQKRYDFLLQRVARINGLIRPASSTSRQEVEKRFGVPFATDTRPIYNGQFVDHVSFYRLMPEINLCVQYQDGKTVKSWITYEEIDFGNHPLFFIDGGGVLGFLVDSPQTYSDQNLHQIEYDYIIAQQLSWKFNLDD